MRVLMLADFYPPILGGVAQHVQTLSQTLARRGHEVAVATLWSEGLLERETDDAGVRVYRLRGTTQRITRLFSDPRHRWAPPMPDPEVLLALRRIVRSERPQIVHGHTWVVHSFVPLKAWSGARLVVSLHELGLRCAKKNLIYREAPCRGPSLVRCLGCTVDAYGPKGALAAGGLWASGAALRRAADIFLPVSRSTAIGSGLVGGRLPYEIVPNFVSDEVDEPPSSAVRAALDELPDEPCLLFVGALGQHKGLHVLLEAYAGLSGAPPLVLIGTPWADTPAAFPTGVRVLQNVPHQAVMHAWRRGLVALIPSLVPEAAPTVALEAMASGVPVIASSIGALPELLDDGHAGLLVPPGDARALREAMQRLLSDAPLRQRLAGAGQQRAGAFRASAVIPRIEHLYSRLLVKQVAHAG
jgi:glycosyltransferase involved in cell wall biosynthesis